MGQGPLVREEIDAGAKFLGDFQKYLPIRLAFWLKQSEEPVWKLYVVSQEITGENFAVAYGEVARIANTLDDDWFDPFQVMLIGVEDPLARGIFDIERTRSGRIPPRLQGRIIGGVSVDDSYFYRLPPSVPTPAEEVYRGLSSEEAASETITRQRGIYLLLVGPPLVPSRRFVHFSWLGESFKLRDYIGGTVIQHSAPLLRPGEDSEAGEGPISRYEIWSAAEVRIPARGELFHRADDSTWWKAKLTEMTSAFESKQRAC